MQQLMSDPASVQPPSVADRGSAKPCPHCGRQNVQAATFCTNCGKRLQEQLPQWGQLPPQWRWRSPPPQRRSPRLWLVVGIVALALLSGIGATVFATHKSTPASSLQVTPQSPIPTMPPPQAPTPPPKPLQSTGAAILGGDITAFIAKYGQPDGNTGKYYDRTWQYFVFSKQAVDVVTTEGRRPLAIFVTAPADATWGVTQAESVCLALAATDRVYQRSMTILDRQGNPMTLQKVYYSASLSNQFPASDFTDENAHQTTPGTFSLVLTYDGGNTSKVLQCAVQIGLQQQ